MKASVLPTSIEVDGRTWKQCIASMAAGATCMDGGLIPTSRKLVGAPTGVDVSRCKPFMEVDEATELCYLHCYSRVSNWK